MCTNIHTTVPADTLALFSINIGVLDLLGVGVGDSYFLPSASEDKKIHYYTHTHTYVHTHASTI